MNSAKKVLSLSQVISRNLHKTKPLNITEEGAKIRRAKILKEQERFQIEDGTPVYIKGGTGDRILLGITCGLLVISLGMSADTLYTLMKKN